MRPILFAHGLEGSPEGRKPTAMRTAGFDVTAPDGRKMVLADRVTGLLSALDILDAPILVGSSYGGLAMLAIARDRPHAFSGLVLCAPALTWNEPPSGDPEALIAPPGTIVLHGRGDSVIPIARSEALVARSPGSTLISVDDDHRLTGSLDRLVDEVRRLAVR